MQTIKIIDEHWAKIYPFLRSCRQVYVGSQGLCRKFLSAVLSVARSGAQWRLLPLAYCNWNSVYKRFARWSELSVFEKLHEFCSQDRDLEHLLIDSTILHAHPCAAGARKNGGQEAQALGRSRGGFSTKLQIAVDALGNGLRVILISGSTNDITQDPALIKDFDVDYVTANKGYDSKELSGVCLFRQLHRMATIKCQQNLVVISASRL